MNLAYVLRRCGFMFFNLLIIIITSAVVLEQLPPEQSIAGLLCNQEQTNEQNNDANLILEQWIIDNNLDKPLAERIKMRIINYLQFDFGTSYFRNCDINHEIMLALPTTLSIALVCTMIIYLLGISLGIILYYNNIFCQLGYNFVLALYSLPLLVICALIAIVFYEYNSSLLAIIGLSIPYAFSVAIFVRSYLRQHQNDKFVIGATARGLSPGRILYAHLIPNALYVVLCNIPIKLAYVLTSTLVIESIFHISGIGTLFQESMQLRDWAITMAIIYLYALIHIILYFMSDLLHTMLNQNINYE